MTYYVYAKHCTGTRMHEAGDAATTTNTCASIRRCCPNARIKVIRGEELKLQPVQIVQEYRLTDAAGTEIK